MNTTPETEIKPDLPPGEILGHPKAPWQLFNIELWERFAYYGIYMGFGIYLQQLGYSKGDLGIIQSIFLALSYLVQSNNGRQTRHLVISFTQCKQSKQYNRNESYCR